MKSWRDSFWLGILPVVMLLGLLVWLAFLQYTWLGKVSDGEREHLQKRLQTDSQRFAEDFNREIGTIYFALQTDSESWRENNFSAFVGRFGQWRENDAFPSLIESVYLVRQDEISQFAADKKTFLPTNWTENFAELREKLKSKDGLETLDEKNLVLIIPVLEKNDGVFVRTGKIPLPAELSPAVKTPEKYGFLLVKLNENTIKNEILPTLAKKYFSESGDADFKLAVVSKQDSSHTIFTSDQNAQLTDTTSDISVPMLPNVPDNMFVFLNPQIRTKSLETRESGKTVVFSQKIERKSYVTSSDQSGGNKTIQVRVSGGTNDAPPIVETSGLEENGRWLLLVQHSEGSLDQFINNTRRKNLAVSFGILSLLAVSIVFIFYSANRAKLLAQKQLEFVSSVSHEFRTPLAVIYSASENLTDGVVNSEKQVVQYGNLIKREGKKLSAMVEQILEFAGARSGRKKYDFSPLNVAEIVENALAECQPSIAEKGFIVEKNLNENLPPINGDANALSHAVQNLINNAIKYSNGEKFLKISTANGNGKVKIIVEDKGIGIPAKEISQIFTPFFRGKDVVDAQIHGNGLGLSLVKQTVEAHGGKILVESKVGEGSRFTIQLAVNS